MTQTQHTRGPWKAQRDIRHQLNTGTLTDDSPKAWAVYGHNSRVACISETLGVDWDKDARAEADAHLIAAAPDLLAAHDPDLLDDLADDLDRGASPSRQNQIADDLRELVAAIRAAIAKAHGNAIPDDPDTWPGGDITGHPGFSAEDGAE
jgi:hypothetical protein